MKHPRKPFGALLLGRFSYVRSLENEIRLLGGAKNYDRAVLTGTEKLNDVLIAHRDVLLANIRDLRIEASCLRREKDELSALVRKLADEKEEAFARAARLFEECSLLKGKAPKEGS